MKKISNLRQGILDNTIDPFSKKSILTKKFFNPFIRNMFKLAIIFNKKVKIINDLDLDPNDTYIFAGTHTYSDDIITTTCYTPHHMYIIFGGTDQIKQNVFMPALVLNGVIRLDMYDKKSRKDCIKIANDVLDYSSIQVYMEAAYCDSENKLHEGFFNSPYILSCNKDKKVVPTINLFDPLSKTSYIMYGEPIEGYKMSKNEFDLKLKEEISSCVYNIIENYIKPHSATIKESNIKYFKRIFQMIFAGKIKKDDRKRKSFSNKTSLDDFFAYRFSQYEKDDGILGWEENFNLYKDPNIYTPSEYISDISKIYSNNAEIITGSHLDSEIKYYEKHNFKKYVENQIGFEIPDRRNDKLNVIILKLIKHFDNKKDLIDFILNCFLKFETNIEYLEIYNLIKLETLNLDNEDTVKYILSNYINALCSKDEMQYDLEYNLLIRTKK